MDSRLKNFLFGTVLLGTFVFPSLLFAQAPVKVIFDTDIGNDVDDVMALALLHNFQNRGDIDLLAVTVTKDNQYAAAFVKMFNTFFGHPDIPIGLVQESHVEPQDGDYLKQTLEAVNENNEPMFPNYQEYIDTRYPDATVILRQTLAASEDHSVVIAMVGFATNLARLLDTPADTISPLTGRELTQQKVKEVLVIGGTFSEELKDLSEYNIANDIPSARKFFTEWPGPVIVNSFETGCDIFMTSQSIEEDCNYVPNHPVKIAYNFYCRGQERPTWDLNTVLQIARPNRNYFTFSEPGTVTVQDNGTTRFEAGPEGNVRLMTATPEQKKRIQEAYLWLCSEMQQDPNHSR